MISHKYNCIYIHIPKTGGSSVNRALQENQHHATLAQEALKVSPEIFKRYFKWATVRNPWDRFVSMYHFRKLHKNMKDDPFCTSNNDWTFEYWLNYHHEVGMEPKMASQLFWITIDDKIELDFVCRFETLNEDFNYVKKHIGFTLDLPHHNKTPHEPYPTYYTKKTIDLVARISSADIEAFKYTFGHTKIL